MWKTLLVSLLLLAFVGACYGQSYNKLMRKGRKHFKRSQLSLALDYFLEAEKLAPGNVELSLEIGRTYLLSDYKHRALPYLSKVHKLAPELDPEIELHLGMACQYNYLFEEAMGHFEAYGKLSRQNKVLSRQKMWECQQADSLIRYPVAVEIENLGPTINSPAHDYAPVITPDESMLVFTSRREGSTGGKKTKENEYYEDIYVSYRRDGSWLPPEQISKNINFKYHDAAAGISPEGRKLFLYLEEGGGDLFEATFDGKNWSEPKSLGPPVNTKYWETSVSMSGDGRTLYFASDRPGGHGGLDVYQSDRQPDGRWGRPRNLGPTINTRQDEDSPYVHPDGQTLYFSSNGHPGLGGFDVFKSEHKEGEWQQPENMGYPVNTPDDNFQFTMAADRTHAYYTSIQEDGVGKADIYRITFLDLRVKAILEAFRQKKEEEEALAQAKQDSLQGVAYFSGWLEDAATGEPLQATVTISNLLNGEVVTELESDSAGGFSVLLKERGNYGLSAEVNGYLILSRTLKINPTEEREHIVRVLRMQPLKVGTTSIMANIFFDSGKSSLRTESLAELEKIRKFLEGAPNLKIRINGHTDNVGNATYNKILSRKRAESVTKYLLQHGIEAHRLSVMGYGQERPLVSNDDEAEGRELNRRTEIEVVSF